MLNTKLVKITCPPIIMDKHAPYTRRMLLANPMLSKPGEYDRAVALINNITPSIITTNPIPKPISRLKYLNKLKSTGRFGKYPKLYVNTRVINANDSIVSPNSVIVPARIRLWKSKRRKLVFTGPKNRIKLAIPPKIKKDNPG